METMATLLTTLGSVFTEVVANVPTILALFTTCVVLQLKLGLKISGAFFGFAQRLLHRV